MKLRLPQRRRWRVLLYIVSITLIALAIDLVLVPYDPARVEGHVVTTARLAEIRATLASLPLARRRKVPGLHPDRAPTIVAGTILLGEVLEAFGLGAFEVSERDILWGVALDVAP